MARIENPALVKSYRSRFPWCEACAILDGNWPVRNIETHHIEGGTDRHDTLDNIINLCHQHHERGTTHNLQYGGSQSTWWNQVFLAIKLLKSEIQTDGHKWESEIRGFLWRIKCLDHLKRDDFYWWVNGE